MYSDLVYRVQGPLNIPYPCSKHKTWFIFQIGVMMWLQLYGDLVYRAQGRLNISWPSRFGVWNPFYINCVEDYKNSYFSLSFRECPGRAGILLNISFVYSIYFRHLDIFWTRLFSRHIVTTFIVPPSLGNTRTNYFFAIVQQSRNFYFFHIWNWSIQYFPSSVYLLLNSHI